MSEHPSHDETASPAADREWFIGYCLNPRPETLWFDPTPLLGTEQVDIQDLDDSDVILAGPGDE